MTLPIEDLTPAQVQALSTLATEHGLCAPCACNMQRSLFTHLVDRACDCGTERSGLCDTCWPSVRQAIEMDLFSEVVCSECGRGVILSEVINV